jgi:hypothetical protein
MGRRVKQCVEVRLREHKHNLKQGLLEKSKLAKHAYEKSHCITWDDARIVRKEPSVTFRE